MLLGLSKNNVINYKYNKLFNKVIYIFIIFISFVFSCLFLINLEDVFNRHIIPYAINVGSDSINICVSEYFTKNNYNYNDLTQITYNENSEITAVQNNTSLMNKIKADISIDLQNTINNLKNDNLYIPLGSLMGSPVFSGIGPKLKIKISPTDITDLVFGDEFESVGLNHTRHKIYAEVFINISVHCMGMSKTEIIEDTILIAETIIVGKVPTYYGLNNSMGISSEIKEE